MARTSLFSLMVTAFLILSNPAFSQSSDPVVATVEGLEIRASEVRQMLAGLPDRFNQIPMETLYPLVLERMIQQRLALIRGREAGLEQDPEVAQRLALLKDQLVHDIFLQRQVDGLVTEKAMREAYKRFLDQNPSKELVRARHILVPDEAQARGLITRILQGEDFATLATNHSTGPSASRGGDLGFFEKDRMEPAFSEAAFALQPNQIAADPIQTRYGWHVILVTDRRTEPAPSFETLAPRIRADLEQEAVFQTLNAIGKQARIERLDLNGKPIAAPSVGEMLQFSRQ